ncbi:MAG: CBS domain-containing protein [Cryomorphaceae bacterium]|nr:CBS domain-containing protein [Cryomorphaceae bacterium]
MELYLDSADIKEIENAFKLGFLSGLTTTPTFMHREGITDVDATILKLAKMVPVLQIEALGKTAEEIVAEAKRQDALGLDRNKTVYKIPISMEGVKACKQLTDEGFLVNIHLVYTLQQAYMAMAAGATYVCPLVGRLQDQGHDALVLVEQCVEAVNYYGYNTKIMFSSVRNVEHVRNAINIGVHTVTVPWKIMQQLTENNFTTVGTNQFFEHTALMTKTIGQCIRPQNPTITVEKTVMDSLVTMSTGGFGAVTIVNDNREPIGFFTDGDLRRQLEQQGENFLQQSLSTIKLNKPHSVEANDLLVEASNAFSKHKVDQLVVTNNGKVVGMIDIQDLVGID